MNPKLIPAAEKSFIPSIGSLSFAARSSYAGMSNFGVRKQRSRPKNRRTQERVVTVKSSGKFEDFEAS